MPIHVNLGTPVGDGRPSIPAVSSAFARWADGPSGPRSSSLLPHIHAESGEELLAGQSTLGKHPNF